MTVDERRRDWYAAIRASTAAYRAWRAGEGTFAEWDRLAGVSLGLQVAYFEVLGEEV